MDARALRAGWWEGILWISVPRLGLRCPSADLYLCAGTGLPGAFVSEILMSKKSTHTVDFGSTKRESHDARKFYARRLGEVKEDKTSTPNTVHVPSMLVGHTSELMHELPNDSVALMVTSPPYHVGKEYDTDESFEDYLSMLQRVLAESFRVLEPGGRAAVNVANLGRKPYVNFAHIVDSMMQEIGFLPRGEIVWIKAKGASGSCAFGSWMKASNPVLRDVHEMILVYSKGRWDRAKSGESTITRDDFLQNTLSVWYMRPESAKRAGHPAPFPLELPGRLIDLYTYEDDLVLDPFMGVGTTCLAAAHRNRRWAGYDTEATYVAAAAERLAREGY